MSDADYEQDEEKSGNGLRNITDSKHNGNRVTPLSDEEVAALDDEADIMNTALWVHLYYAFHTLIGEYAQTRIGEYYCRNEPRGRFETYVRRH